MRRRDFLATGAAAAGALCLREFASPAVRAAAATDSRIDVLVNEPLGTIAPTIYGHFAENLSGVIYDGMWVGERSRVANIAGIRRELVEQMRRIKPPVVRFPGGCFADSYDWRDGVGPRERRPRRTNFWASGERPSSPASHRYDPNQFGTNEFVRFCREIGAQPYLAANLRSLPAEAFQHWVEYCNSPAGSTTLADLRAQTGEVEPFHVRYWGIGNEAWGCGGKFTAQEYAVEFRRFTAWVPGFGDRLAFIASGPNGDDREWTRGFFEEIVRKGRGELRGIFGWALHHYAWNLSRGKTEDWNAGKGDALDFDAVDWYELLREGWRLDAMIAAHWQAMGDIDRDHVVKLVVDEWGPWYRPGSAATPDNQLEQMPTLRDAVFSGMTLDIFNRHPDKVAMANCAQLVNCLNSLYLAHEDRFSVTPVGHVFAMYAPHQGGTALRTVFAAPDVAYDRDGRPAGFWGLNGSASLQGKTLTLTVVNPHVSEPRAAEVVIRGGGVAAATATVLTHADLHAHNSFEHRDVVAPRAAGVNVTAGGLVHTFPAASVTALSLTLR